MEIRHAEIEQALHELAERVEPDLSRSVTRIVWANYDQGRIHQFLSNGNAENVCAYIDLVLTHYDEQHEYVQRLQEAKDTDLWQALFQRLQKYAYRMLSKFGFLEPRQRFEHALQCATDASLVIADRRFPFDTQFDAWVYMILFNTCRNHVRNETRGRSVPPGAQVSLDAYDGWLQNLEDPGSEQMHRRFEQRYDLLDQIERLGDAQREFVLLYYFEQKSYAEVGQIMGKKTNTLYKLNFDALDSLRKNFLVGEQSYE